MRANAMPTLRFSVALERFLLQVRADGRSPHTVNQLRRHAERLRRWCRAQRIPDDLRRIDDQVVARFFVSAAARHRPDGNEKQPGSANAMRSSLRTFFGYLTDAGLLTHNPARLIRRAKCGPPLPRALGEDDQRKLMAVLARATDPAGHRDHILFRLMLETGIRLGSALGIDVADVDLCGRRILLRSFKGARQEEIRIGAGLARELRRLMGRRGGGPVFVRRDGTRVSARHVQRRFKHWQERAGVARPVSPHGLRHAFADATYARTRDMLGLQRALGHQSITATMIYLRGASSACQGVARTRM